MTVKRRRLADRRRAVGHTQESLAGRLGVNRTTVVRWERAETEPQPWVRPHLAEALGISPDELTSLLDQIEESRSRQDERLRYVLRNPRAADLATVISIRRTLRVLAHEYDRVPSTTLLARASRIHAEVAILRSHALGGAVRQALQTVEAESSILMGQLVWDASHRRDSRTAITYYQNAVVAAKHCRDPIPEAHARLRSSFVALYGDRNPRAGLEQSTHSARLAGERGGHGLAGLALLHVGEANAMLGERSACERALGAAEDQLSQMGSFDPTSTLLSTARVRRVSGSCQLFLGNARKAEAVLRPLSAALHEQPKSRGIVLGNLALAHIRQREIESATAALQQAIDLVEANRGGGALNVLFTAGRALSPWRARSEVQDVIDRMFALMAV
ncbi:MAG TPA: helix-turn-helix transcriptional regulator [Micromonospora sp.]